jgi:hypothetical protein
MDLEKIRKYVGYAIRGLLALLLLMIGASFMAADKKARETLKMTDDKPVDSVMAASLRPKILPDPWPPRVHQAYPDLKLFDSAGRAFSLSLLKGKVVVVEMVDMTSPLSQAYAGARTYGVLGGDKVDPFAATFPEVLAKYSETPVALPHSDIIMLKLILFGPNQRRPTVQDAASWATHFHYSVADNVIVAVPQDDWRGDITLNLVPGFQLIDRSFLLRADSAGPSPRHNLFFILTPMVAELLKDKP